MRGTIIRKRDEGYGFIKPEEGDKDVFFHASSLAEGMFDDVMEGDTVTFDIEEGPKGPAAVNVMKTDAMPMPEAAAEPTMDMPMSDTGEGDMLMSEEGEGDMPMKE